MSPDHKKRPASGPTSPDPGTIGMKEIARVVGVSKTTVHRALTGSGRISEDTRRRILEVAHQWDYLPNDLGRSLRQRRTGAIGVITSFVSNSFFASLLSAIEEAASSQGFSLVICCSEGSVDLEENHINILRERRVDGLLIAPACSQGASEHFERLKRADIPFVFIDNHVPSVSTDTVMTDHRLGGQLVARHLLDGNRSRFGVISTTDDASWSAALAERIAGFMDIAVPAGAEITRIGRQQLWNPWEDYGQFCLADFLDNKGSVDAIFALNDQLAIGALSCCHTRGLKVPDDIAVAGFDDLEVSRFMTPRLTTVRQPTRQIAWEAVKLLLARMGGDRSDRAHQVRLRPVLMQRDSTPRPTNARFLLDPDDCV